MLVLPLESVRSSDVLSFLNTCSSGELSVLLSLILLKFVLVECYCHPIWGPSTKPFHGSQENINRLLSISRPSFTCSCWWRIAWAPHLNIAERRGKVQFGELLNLVLMSIAYFVESVLVFGRQLYVLIGMKFCVPSKHLWTGVAQSVYWLATVWSTGVELLQGQSYFLRQNDQTHSGTFLSHRHHVLFF